jgi:arylsulfatase A-like enzyme
MAIDFMRHSKGSSAPFALFLSWGPPHDPWDWNNVVPEYADLYRRVDLPLRPNYTDQPDPYTDAWQKLPPNYNQLVHDWQRAYYAQTVSIDYNIGRLHKALEDEGLSDNTIFVFTSDHGEMFGSHGRHAKYIFYEEAARVPFLMRWPGKIPAKHVSDALLGTPDIMPTILSLLNLPIPAAVEGMDLSGHALGKGGSDHDAAHMQGMGATAAWTDGSEWRALRDHEYTYAIYHRDRKELLFNNRKDPYQMTNLADDRSQTAKLAHYRSLSENWRRQQNDTFEACSWYENRWTKDRNVTNTAKGVGQNLSELEKITEHWFPDGVGDRTS